jgi:hypothetical protein
MMNPFHIGCSDSRGFREETGEDERFEDCGEFELDMDPLFRFGLLTGGV